MLNLFKRTLALSQLLISKSKKTLGVSLGLMPSFKASIEARVKGVVSNVGYLENWRHSFIQNKYATHIAFVLLY